MEVKIPEAVNVVELETAPFNSAFGARCWSIEHGIVGLMSDVDTCGKGGVSISVGSIRKMVSGSALEKSVTHEIHYAALVRLRDIIRESFVIEVIKGNEILKGIRRASARPNDRISMSVGI